MVMGIIFYFLLYFITLPYLTFLFSVPPGLLDMRISALYYVLVTLKCEQKGGERSALKSCLHRRSLPLPWRSDLSGPFMQKAHPMQLSQSVYADFFILFLFIFRHRSCTWTFAPRWTLRGTGTAAHVRYPPTAPGSPPTQRCQIPHVSHPVSESANLLHSRSVCTKLLHPYGFHSPQWD